MAENLVFITGATGHIGFKTLVVALQSGYNVRAAIRSASKKSQILSAPSIKALNPGSRLSFVIVPDLTAEGAYDEAVKGATHIIHLASPIVMKGEIKPENYQVELIDPAVAGTVSVLKAAAKTAGVKRVVITSSVVAIVAAKWFFEEEAPEDVVFDHNSRTPFESGPYPTDFHAYNASKVAALEATDAFVRDQKPEFDIVNINPSFVIGRNELIADVKDITLGTNGAALGVILGNKLPYPVFGASVHVDDGKLLHMLFCQYTNFITSGFHACQRT
jgi:nucleoside-diphosphate-sugar epimerase